MSAAVTDTEHSCRLLVVDSDPILRAEIAEYLSRFRFSVCEAGSACEMGRMLSETTVDLVILEPELSDGDGLVALRESAHMGHEDGVRCIVLTGNGEPVDRIVSLELGADDYLVKPTNRRELLARVRAVLRRAPVSHAHVNGHVDQLGDLVLRAGGLKFDRLRRTLLKTDGTQIRLTTSEFNLLSVFTEHANVPLGRDRLYELVYHRSWNVYDRTLDTLVAKLRRKIEEDPQQPELIKTVHGVGYVFVGISLS